MMRGDCNDVTVFTVQCVSVGREGGQLRGEGGGIGGGGGGGGGGGRRREEEEEEEEEEKEEEEEVKDEK